VPTANGQLQLADYDAALLARGFDAFQPAERAQMINLGYRYIARKFPFFWERSSHVYIINPGDVPLSIQGGAPLTANSVIGVDITADPYRRKLEVATQEYFRRRWQYQDYTAQQNRAIPSRYYVYAGSLYLLPPPQAQITVTVFYYQYLADMIATTDTPVTPQVYDEAILDAALVRCHRRAHELQLAGEAQARVDDALDDMLSDDIWEMEELQERVLPDDQWL